MRFEIPVLALLVSAVTAMPGGAGNPNDPECKKVCNYGQYPKCSAKYNDGLQKCVSRGCVKFIRDPFLDCATGDKCQNPFHVCSHWQNEKQCSPEWRENLQACLATGCIKFKKDPFESCPRRDQCAWKDHACKTYTNYDQCSAEWKKDLKTCVDSGCIQWFADPFNVCKKQENPHQKRWDPSCKKEDHVCKTYNQLPHCSEEWVEALELCKASNCIQWFRDPMDECKKDNQPIEARSGCSSNSHPCNQYERYRECGQSWTTLLKACQKSGCRQWFQDPFNVCKRNGGH